MSDSETDIVHAAPSEPHGDGIVQGVAPPRRRRRVEYASSGIAGIAVLCGSGETPLRVERSCQVAERRLPVTTKYSRRLQSKRRGWLHIRTWFESLETYGGVLLFTGESTCIAFASMLIRLCALWD